jgi:hypothetical protein
MHGLNLAFIRGGCKGKTTAASVPKQAFVLLKRGSWTVAPRVFRRFSKIT